MAKKQTSRGRKQDRARVAGGQDYEVPVRGEENRQIQRCGGKAVTSRKRMERRLAR